MQQRFGLDCIQYLTEVSIRPDAASQAGSDDAEAQRLFLERQIDYKRRELNELMDRRNALEPQNAAPAFPRFMQRILGR
jgi:hypothetical protein